MSDDRILSIIEIVSPGNKDSANTMRTFIHMASELLDQRIYLVVLDPAD